jgi:uncharacterized protein YaaQ
MFQNAQLDFIVPMQVSYRDLRATVGGEAEMDGLRIGFEGQRLKHDVIILEKFTKSTEDSSNKSAMMTVSSDPYAPFILEIRAMS